MEDEVIVDLFWDRDDNALKLIEEKYGTDFLRMSFRILNNKEDSEECVNDAYLKTWKVKLSIRNYRKIFQSFCFL